LRTAAAYTLKNLVFKCAKDIKVMVMKELTNDRLIELLEDENFKVQEQVLMIYRNLLFKTEEDI
jgi:hypothetical protein